MDFVQLAITKILTGQRTVPKKEKSLQDFTEQDLFSALASIISSDISHLAESKENKITFRLETLPHWINTPSITLTENITNEECQKKILTVLEGDSVAQLIAKTII